MGKKSRVKKEKRKKKEEDKKQGIKSFDKEFHQSSIDQPKTKIEFICLFIIRWAVYLMLLTPLVVNSRFFFPFVGPKGLYLMGLIEIAFFSWLVLVIHSPQYRPKKNILLLCLGAFLIFLTLATIFGVDPSRSFWSKFERMSGLLMWLHLFGLFLVVSTVLEKRNWLKIFLSSIVIAQLTCFMFWMEIAGIESMSVARKGSTLGNSSFFSTYLLFNLFFAIYSFSVIKRLKEFRLWSFEKLRLIYLIFLPPAILLMIISMWKSGGRAATLAFFGGIGLLGLLYLAFETRRKTWKILGKITLIISIIVFISGIIMLYLPNSLVQEWLAEKALKSREAIWQNALDGFQEKPILGWGPQNFSMVFNKHFDSRFYLSAEYGPDVRFDQAHNIIMDNIVDSGTLGLLSYLSIFGAAFWALWRGYKKRSLCFWTAAIPAVLLITHFTQNLTVFDMPASLLMLFLTFGFVAVLTQQRDKNLTELKKNKRPIGIWLLIIPVLFIFCFSYFVIKPAKANTGVIKVMMGSSAQQRISAYEQAFYSSPTGRYQIRSQIAVYLMQAVSEKREVSKEEFDIVSQELEKSIKSSPMDYYSHLILGKLYNLYSQTDKEKLLRAEEVLERAIELSPTKQAAYWELTRTKILLGENEDGIALAEKAIELEPRVAYSHLYLVSMAMIIKDADLAIQKAQEAIKILPELGPQLKGILGVEEF